MEQFFKTILLNKVPFKNWRFFLRMKNVLTGPIQRIDFFSLKK
jgi:hypothetical protein